MMFRKPINQPTLLDNYTTREGELNFQSKKDTIYDSAIFGYIATLLFVIIDFCCLNSSWTVVDNSSNSTMILLISIGCAFSLDVPMAIAGNVAKQYYQKLINKKGMILIVSLCIACFLIVFSFQVCFRMVTRADTFSENASTIQMSNMVNENADTPKVIVAALFSAIIPLCTSIASFVITFFSSHPLEHRINRLQMSIIHNESRLIELKQCLIEAGNTKEHLAFLLGNEEDNYRAFLDTIKAEGALRKQAIRHAICQALNSPEQTAIVEQSGNSINANVLDENQRTETEVFLAKKTIDDEF